MPNPAYLADDEEEDPPFYDPILNNMEEIPTGIKLPGAPPLQMRQRTSPQEPSPDPFEDNAEDPRSVVSSRVAASGSPQPQPPAARPQLPSPPNTGEVEGVLRQYPQLTQPKWWQRGLGAVAGGLAGYSNAAGRTKHPVDIGAMEQNILHPGYQEQMAEYQSKLAPAEARLNLETQQNQAFWKTQLQGAEAQRAQDQAAYYAARSQGQWMTNSKTGETVNRFTGQRLPPATKPADTYSTVLAITHDPQAALHAAWPNTRQTGSAGAAQRPTVLPPGAAAIQDGKVLYTNPNRPQREPDAASEELKRERLEEMKRAEGDRANAQADKVGQQKAAAEKAAVDRYNANVTADPLKKHWPEFRAQEAQELQAASNNYAEAVKHAGGTPQYFDVDPKTAQSRPRSAPGQGPPAPAPVPTSQAAPPQAAPTPATAPQTPKYLKFATDGKVRMGFNAHTKQWEPAQ